MSDISVTQILRRLREDEDDESRQLAAAQLYQRYRRRVEQIAKGRLMPSGGLADEEDVAQSAFRSFFGRIEAGQLDALVSGGQAWAILARLTRNKAIDSVRYDNALCRGGEGARRNSQPSGNGDTGTGNSGTGDSEIGRNRLGIGDAGASASKSERVKRASSRREDVPLDAVHDSGQRSAEEEAVSREILEVFLEQLSEATLRGIVALKLEGFTNEEIATKIGCATRTVERKLNLIRRLWNPILEDRHERPRS